MKTITLLLSLFICSLTFSQTDIVNFEITSQFNTTFTYTDQFEYQFEIQGDYGYKEIKLNLYYESITANNLIGLIRWNREGDDDLIFNSYTLKNMWVNTFMNWNGRTFNTNPGKVFYLVTEYEGVTQTYSYTIPEADSDGDGIVDSQDSCPYEYGTQPNGCPPLPDLTLSSLKINNGNIFPGGLIPTFEYNEAINFEIKINNNGEANSGNFTCLILAGGSPTSYPGPNYASPAYNFATANFSNIDAGDDRTVNITEYVYDYIGSLNLYEGQTYYMFIDIDYNDSVEEGDGEDNNLSVFAFEYSCPSCRVAYLNTSNGVINIPLDNVENDNIKIYNINNVSFPVVNQSIDEQETLNVLLLPGIYAIHINDTFVKKFKL